jgi:hypothetical protein
MTRPAKLFAAILVAAALSSCGREGTPTGPSGPTSFLAGTWRGTVTIQINPGDPNPPAPVQLAARMSRDVRECRNCGGDPDRGGLHGHGLSTGHSSVAGWC